MPQPSSRPLRIAMIGPPWYEIPPEGYGGTEAMCATLIDELVARGHEVTLVGAGEPETPAQRFIPVFDEPMIEQLDKSPHKVMYIAEVEVLHAARMARALAGLDVDLVHDHSLAGPLLASGRRVPTVVTAHSLEGDELAAYYRALGDVIGLVAISHAQQDSVPDLPWVGTVYNAITVDDFPFRTEKDDYVLFLGRISRDKGPELAIDAARAAGKRILLAGMTQASAEQAHFDEFIRPRLGPEVEWLGEADKDSKKDLLARARCLVFPIQWNEPFGLVMVEAMACGTPVVALRRGSVPEVVIDGVTGVICDELEELPEAIEKAEDLRPEDCREHVRSSFSVSSMAAGYERVYRAMLDRAGPV